MPKLLTSFNIHNGALGKKKVQSGQYFPTQMLPVKEKDLHWREETLDFFEQVGLKHIKYNSKKYLKNYQLSKGVIDKNDYVTTSDNEYSGIINNIVDENSNSALTLQFYPIVPNVINVLLGEFSQRDTKNIVYAVDNYTQNEKLDALYADVENYLISKAQQDILIQAQTNGFDENNEEQVQALQQSLEGVKSLPEISDFYRKNYRSLQEEWATHQLNVDEERFNIYELENDAINDYLNTKREFWHINLMEDDYDLELWNPISTFCHVSPDIKYVSDGNYVGRITMMSASDIISRYKMKLKSEEIEKLEVINKASMSLNDFGVQPGAYYDITKPRSMQYPNSVHYEKVMAFQQAMDEGFTNSPNLYESLLNGKQQSEITLIRVTEVYWKSFKKVGWLTKITETGEITESEMVSEHYEVTDEPVYDTTLTSNKTKDNLIFGEHIEWTWVPEVWKGVKIGGNFQFNDMSSLDKAIYIDVAPLKFQFKGDKNLYDAKLPVEGPNFLNRLEDLVPFVSLMAPFQIIHNLAVNQAKDISIDELGNIILLDQNTLPRESLGEEWGKNNFGKVYDMMKNYGILPIDTSLTNTEVPLNFQHFQQLDMSSVNRIKSKLDLADWAERRCFAAVGITPERLGVVMASQTATGTTQAVQNSYAQTEQVFTDHIIYIMPRVRMMLLNAAQYYNTSNPSIRLSYVNSKDENAFFEINGTDLLLPDFNINTTGRPDKKRMLEQLKQLALSNNTTNASILDLNTIMQSDSTSEVIRTLKKSADEFQQQQEAQKQHEQEIVNSQIQAESERQDKEQAFQREENQKDREAKLIGDQIKALGFAKDTDLDKNAVPDVLEAAKFSQQIQEYQTDLELRNKEMDLKNREIANTKSVQDKKLETDKYIADRKLEAEYVKLKNPVVGESKTKKK